MCAIVGFCDSTCCSAEVELEHTALGMASALRHRGPDDHGAWADDAAGVALGHRRLAILDLTREGHQPMRSEDERYVLVFNGEIYNFKSLREELEQRGHVFRGYSDTEAMLAAFCEWGLLAALERFAGMFAFALWDRQNRRLHLVRDRAGEKPLYYGWSGGVFVFGSELKALQAHPRWRVEINRGALALLLRYGCIPAPHCIYENIYKLSPGCVLTLNQSHIRARQLPEPAPYWSAPTVAAAGAAQPFDGAAEEAGEQLRALLLHAVRQQMVADVPLGAFLSGGIDSSLVVALMQAQSRRPIKTFSIGFQQEKFNEAPFAKNVAALLGTDHTELYVQDEDLRQVIPKLSRIYDEPFADPSQIPTALLCRLAGAHVKVSLSGDAGDELFGGYSGYRKAQRLWRAIRRIPQPLRGQLARGLKSFSGAGLEAGFVSGRARRLFNRLSNLADVLPAPSDRALYRLLMSPHREPRAWLKDGSEPPTRFETISTWDALPELLQRMTCLDFVSYLPDDILVKVDRAAMSVSLETRIPLLDHRIVEFAFRLPVAFKQKGNTGKWLLRQILYQYVPRALVDRPKKGFAAPIAGWLRGPMRDWAEDLLDETRLRQEGFFDDREVRARWQEHLSRKRDWSPGLWHTLMFQAWLDEQKTRPDSDLEGGDMSSLSSMQHSTSGQSADTSAQSKSGDCVEPARESEACQVSIQK
ncbi:MAG: asparagine synthase (glutamine-hydrolyzing) [Verrucomicrobiota bacterium]|nr:asparagine synthase (glutamine-hydrolyzing) [Verrucomicrobiota bacterium]